MKNNPEQCPTWDEFLRPILELALEEGGAGQPLLTRGQLKVMIIPVSLLEEQKRVVTILDKFDALANTIVKGLPSEIALRQQQYEYCRDLLLRFPKRRAEEAA